ncbi:MAG: hypothetical protein ACJ8GJ_23160 [Vitreoscilla sp.]
MRLSKFQTVLLSMALPALLAGCFPLPNPYYDYLPNAAGGSLKSLDRDYEHHAIEFQAEGVRVQARMTGGIGPTFVLLKVEVPAGSSAHFAAPTLSLVTAQWTLPVSLTEPPAIIPRYLPPSAPRPAPRTGVDGTMTGPGVPGAASASGLWEASLRITAPDATAYDVQLPDLLVDGRPPVHFPAIHFAKVTHVRWDVPM